MKLSDKVWRLCRYHGIEDGTVASFTRGDHSCDEFFTSEAEAHAADSARCEREGARYRADSEEWFKKATVAAGKAKAAK